MAFGALLEVERDLQLARQGAPSPGAAAAYAVCLTPSDRGDGMRGGFKGVTKS